MRRLPSNCYNSKQGDSSTINLSRRFLLLLQATFLRLVASINYINNKKECTRSIHNCQKQQNYTGWNFTSGIIAGCVGKDCSVEYSEDLLYSGVDVSRDIPTIHPHYSCNPCRVMLKRASWSHLQIHDQTHGMDFTR